VRGNPRAADLFEEGIGVDVERVGEQPRDVAMAVTAWRKADVVNNDQFDGCAGRSGVEIRRALPAYACDPAVRPDAQRVHGERRSVRLGRAVT